MAISTKTEVLYIQVRPNGKTKLVYSTQVLKKGIVVSEQQESLVINDGDDMAAKVAAENARLVEDDYPALKTEHVDIFSAARALVANKA